VWANTIAVVLVALSIGYWFGGRMADRHPDRDPLCLLVLVASGLLALVPIVSQPFLSLSVDAFDNLSLGAGFGSLLGVLALVAVPVLMLGAVSPWAIRLKLESIEDSGQTAGRMYAISTVGSLLGTFASALLLIPLAGTQRTFLTFALALAVVAALGLPRRWWLVPVAIAALFAVPVGTVKASDEGRVIHETDTEYQYARVVERSNGERTLELNEGQAIHSLYRRETVLSGGYWDGFLTAPFATRATPPRRVAMLGFAGGTVARAYERFFPAARIDGVEIDGELFDIARRYFGLRPRPQLHEYAEDARPFLRRTSARYDVIYLDTYRQPYIPFYLSTREFFALARDRLAPGGSIAINVGHPEANNELERVLSATMGRSFRFVARDPVNATSTILIGSQTRPTPGRLRAAAEHLPAPLRPLALAEATRLAPNLRGGSVYTDDRAPVEWLIDKAIVEYAAGDGG
jgi:spermidine synthase